MPYLVQGSAQQLAELFGTEKLVAAHDKADGAFKIKVDLPRTQFLGSQEQAKHHVKLWQESTNQATYLQGDMSAGNAFLLLGDLLLLKKEDEELEDYRTNCIRYSMGYINSEQNLAGFMVMYRKDNPSQWLLAVSEHNELSQKERKITLLTSFDLNAYVKQPSAELTPSVVDRVNNKLIEQLKSPFLKGLLTYALQADNGEINIRFARIKQILRFLNSNGELQIEDPINLEQINPRLLLAENPTLDLITHYKLNLSFKMLVDCLEEKSGLRKEVESLRLTDKPKVNECLLKMTVHFYEQGILNEYRAVLQEQLFKKVYAGTVLNNEQIQITPFLIKKKYSPALVQLILSNEAYYRAVADLITLGLTQDIPEFFANPDKLNELEFLNAVKDKSIKQMCLIFWVKGNLSTKDYEDLIKAGETYPLLAETLIASDKTGEFSIQGLKAWALNPQKQLQQSIIHHFGKEYPVNKVILGKLDVRELEHLSRAFIVLKRKEGATKDLYELAARDHQQGHLLRLFLPSLAHVIDPDHRNALIDLLYTGVQKGPISLGKAVAAIKDEGLRKEASHLHDRLLCAKQLQDLGFTHEQVSFAVEAKNEDANKWRHVILKVEAQCKDILERLLRGNKLEEQKKSWQEAEKKYRQSMYQIAYQAIKDPDFDFQTHLAREQSKVLKIVDPKIESWAYKCLIVIANIFITALTLALANEYKYRKTGNFWFFNQTTSGEELRAMEKDLTEHIRPNKSPATL